MMWGDTNMTEIYFNDALKGLQKLKDESVNCCVTSPPYYALRDYGVTGQIGLEPTPEEYIEKLVRIFHEVKRVLRDDGTLWVNIADSYAGSGKGRNRDGKFIEQAKNIQSHGQKNGRLSITPAQLEIKRKDLIGIPWMLAFALRADGWYLRQDIIWQKPNAMPESVKDRCTKSHEYIFLLSKQPTYYFNHEAIKEACVGFDKSSPRGSKGAMTPNSGRRKGNNKSFRGGGIYTNNRSFQNSAEKGKQTVGNVPNDTGLRNRRSVWTVATQGCSEAHYATFPKKLIEPCVLAGCPKGGTVLDPFLGSGTTALVAKEHERNCIGIELNVDYKPIIEKRLGDSCIITKGE